MAEPGTVHERISEALGSLVRRFQAEIDDARFVETLPKIRPTPLATFDDGERVFVLCRLTINRGAVLTDREVRIALGVRDNLSDKEIAYKLKLSLRTTAAHLERIFLKLGFHSRIELAMVASLLAPASPGEFSA